MLRDRRVVLGGLCWLIGLQWFVVQVVTQAAWPRPYSLLKNTLSDLGAVHCFTEKASRLNPDPVQVCSPLHALMNGSYVAFGLMIIAGVVLLWAVWPRRRASTIGLILLGLLGLGKIVIGLAPEDQRLGLHALGTLGMLCGVVGSILLAVAVRRASRWSATVFLCIGIVGVVAFVLQFLAPLAGIRGALERLADWPLPLWLAFLGLLGLLGRWPLAKVSAQDAVAPS